MRQLGVRVVETLDAMFRPEVPPRVALVVLVLVYGTVAVAAVAGLGDVVGWW